MLVVGAMTIAIRQKAQGKNSTLHLDFAGSQTSDSAVLKCRSVCRGETLYNWSQTAFTLFVSGRMPAHGLGKIREKLKIR